MSNELSNGNSDSREKRERNLLFWVPFVLLFLISVLFFTICKNAVIGWVLLVLFFVIIFLLRKFMSKFGAVYIICLIAVFIIIFAVFSYSVPGKSNNASLSETSSTSNSVGADSSALKTVQFSNSYIFPDNKGSYVVKIDTDTISNNYVLTLTVTMPKEAIPDGFKWDVNKITETVTVGTQKVAAEDYVGVYWQSANSTPDYYDTCNLGTLVASGKMSTDPSTLNGFKDAVFTRNANSLEELKKYMQAGDKLCLYWYNVSEVGAAGDDGSVQIHNEKGYGIHPSIAEAIIPWSDIISSFGI